MGVLDGSLLDNKKFTKNSVEYFITNECDNGFTFRFPLKAWRQIMDGDRQTITARVSVANVVRP